MSKLMHTQEELHAAYGWIEGELAQRGASVLEAERDAQSISQLVPQTNSYTPRLGLSPEQGSAADRGRLQLRLDLFGLSEKPVLGDGACQFRALADQLYGSPEDHATVRERTVVQLRRHSDWYSGYVPEEYETYCSQMAEPTAWGDHVTLQAAADAYGVRIALVTSFPDTAFLEITPREETRSSRSLWLSFWAEVHYNSIYPKGETPAEASPPRPQTPLPHRPKILGSRKLHFLLVGD